MGLISCRFPEHGQPLDLARAFQQQMAPIVVEIDEADVYAASIAKLELLLDGAGKNKETYPPLLSMKRLAAQYAPQFKLVLRVDQAPVMQGAINRRSLNLTWSDTIPTWILSKILVFSKGISAAEIEAYDGAGNLIDIETAAYAYATT